MELEKIFEIDHDVHTSFVKADDYEGGHVSYYSDFASGVPFKGRGIDLAATVCEALYIVENVEGSNLWIGEGKTLSGEVVHTCLYLHSDGVLYEMGDIRQGGYDNAAGMPYRKPRTVEMSDYTYDRMFSFSEGWVLPSNVFDKVKVEKIKNNFRIPVRTEKHPEGIPKASGYPKYPFDDDEPIDYLEPEKKPALMQYPNAFNIMTLVISGLAFLISLGCLAYITQG